MAMCDVDRTPAARRYVFRTMAAMTPYVLICVAMMVTDLFDGLRNSPMAWGLALVMALPIVVQLWAMLAYMKESDEFMRALMARRFIVATGVTFAIAVFWGFADNFGAAPHLPVWLIVPVFYAAFGFVSPFVRSSNG